MIQVGNHLPQGQLVEFVENQEGKSGPQVFNAGDAAKGKKIAVLALPLTFSGNALQRIEACSRQGIEEIWCFVGQDPAFVAAWRKKLQALSGKLRLVSDGNGVYVQALGLSAEPGVAGNATYRSSLLVDDGIVKRFDVDVSIRPDASNDGKAVAQAA